MLTQLSTSWLMDALARASAGLFIFICGLITAKLTRSFALKRMSLRSQNATLKTFLVNVAYSTIVLITCVIALTQLGVETSSLVAILGASTLAIGLSLRDFLANIAAGFMIIFIQPFKIGDVIICGNCEGTVMDINLFITEIQTNTHEAVFIPNSELTKSSVTNKTHYADRRLDFSVTVALSNPIENVKSLLLTVVKNEVLALPSPDPRIRVEALHEHGVELMVSVWTSRTHYGEAKSHLLEAIKMAFEEHKIALPDTFKHPNAR